MVADLLEALEVLAHFAVELVRQQVRVLAIDDVPARASPKREQEGKRRGVREGNSLLPVDEPLGDLELERVLHDRDDALELVRVELAGTGEARACREHEGEGEGASSSVSVRPARFYPLQATPNTPLAEVDVSLLANQVRIAATNTLDLGQGVLRDPTVSARSRTKDADAERTMIFRLPSTLVLSKRRMCWNCT